MTLRLALGCLTLLTPYIAFAAPNPVSNVRASLTDDARVQVEWDPVPGNVASYRVYYSSLSILQNNGDYDDYEEVLNAATQHTLADPLLEGERFVAVLAVATDGSESVGFLEEAVVRRDAMPEEELVGIPVSVTSTPSDSQVSASSTPMNTDIFRLLSVEPSRQGALRLTFSHEAILQGGAATDAISVQAQSGLPVAIDRVEVMGAQIIVFLRGTMVEGETYDVRVATDRIRGKPKTNTVQPLLVLDASAANLSFLGVASTPADGSAPLTGVRVIQMRATQRPMGGYDVLVRWETAGSPDDVVAFDLAQSADGGQSFGSVQRLDGSLSEITIRGVPGGTYAVWLAAVLRDGQTSTPLTQSITLSSPAVVASSSSSQMISIELPSTTTQMNEPGKAVSGGVQAGLLHQPTAVRLPSSGISLSMGLLTLALGACSGTLVQRRRLARS